MSTGLIALLDDVVALAKVAAASLDDAAGQAAKASAKAAGIVIDDAAVTPRYVVGFASDRELPIIYKIAIGSLKNKLLILLPGALLLAWLAPWLITPLLMLGGAYLSLEGFHKVMDLFHVETPPATVAVAIDPQAPMSAAELEDLKVKDAIRTDFILSAEIMAISMASVAASSTWVQALVLALVGAGITVLVYGTVAIIVRADDWGAALARSPRSFLRPMGRAILLGMPYFLTGLSHLGMVAMLWVGGGILIHGLHGLGWSAPENAVHAFALAFSPDVPVLGPSVEWLLTATIAALIGLALGAVCALLHKRLRAAFAGRRAPAK